MVAKYGELYSQARSDLVDFLPRKHLTYEIRLDTLDALDELKELSSAEELKNKLLFSVVVVSIIFVNFQYLFHISGSTIRIFSH